MNQAFSKENRLLKPQDFDCTFKSGTKVTSQNLVMVVHKTSSDCARLGLVVSRKAGNAVVRNRIKRLVRECFRKHKSDYSGLDVVVIAKPNFSGSTQRDMDCELNSLRERVLRRIEKLS